MYFLPLSKWQAINDWYNILEDIAGFKSELVVPFWVNKLVHSEKECPQTESISKLYSVALFLRQTYLIAPDIIPEIDIIQEELLEPWLNKWASAIIFLRQVRLNH